MEKPVFLTDSNDAVRTISHTGEAGYTILISLYLLASIWNLVSIYVMSSSPTLTVLGLPFAWVILTYTFYCLWVKVVQRRTLYSLKVFLVCVTFSIFVITVFGKSGLFSVIINFLPTVIILVAWLFSRRAAYALTGSVCLLFIYLYFHVSAEQVSYARSQPVLYLSAMIFSVLSIGFFGGIISKSNEKHHENQSRDHARKMESLFTLVAGIAKNLDNPLGNNRMASSSLSDLIDKLSENFESDSIRKSDLKIFLAKSKEMVSLASNSAGKAYQLVETFKRLSLSDREENIATFSLKEAIMSAVTLAKDESNGWYVETSNLHDVVCETYLEHFQAILVTLLENAFRHGGFSGIATVSTRLCGDIVQVTISDDGVGIQKEDFHKIFEPFYSPDATKIGGLGLAIAYHLSSILKGSISFREQSIGTCVVVSFLRNVRKKS